VRRQTSRALSVLVAIALATTSCGGDSKKDAGAQPCPDPSPAHDLSLIPSDIPIDRHSMVTTVAKSRGFVGVIGVSDKKIVELVPILSRALLDSGYDIRQTDNEGFEAEIYFTRGKTVGNYRMREGPCTGQVTVKLLYKLTRAKKAA
jgi:hypothetical protein